ncbi:MAG TPA: 5-formyltetrahydrofolate cyclo-ligase [Lachnospiraceae bacterium]|nr:5-formyltetrahydrofolate cyclo-ligase [Lachnospiraceae bacterium]
MMETKKEIRERIFALREKMPEAEKRAGSRKAVQRLLDSECFKTAAAIYTYVGFRGEVGTDDLIRAAWKDGKTVGVPKVEGAEIRFYILNDFTKLRPGSFHVPEPLECPVAQEEKALVIVPGVAFDEERNRIGYGKGFYDRYLCAHPDFPTAALAFEFQVLKQVPQDDGDIRPQMIFTEKRCIV